MNSACWSWVESPRLEWSQVLSVEQRSAVKQLFCGQESDPSSWADKKGVWQETKYGH